jgi:hypothetical protein
LRTNLTFFKLNISSKKAFIPKDEITNICIDGCLLIWLSFHLGHITHFITSKNKIKIKMSKLVLDGYEKMIINQAGFKVKFQVEYIKVLPKVIPYLKLVHQFSLE